MKLTNSEKEKFTLQDFEKGLMLAGFLTPKDLNEIKEKEMLTEHDKSISRTKKEIYFKRAVLAAEIVDNLKEEFTFGRIKFQKLVYLCENVAHMNISSERYKKFAAGPFDNKFMYSINAEFKKQKWFGVNIIKDGKFTKPQYYALENKEKYKEYYLQYFADQNESIQQIIELFRKERTHFTELIATLFFCWKEIYNEKQKYSDTILCQKFYNFSEEKKKFTQEEILKGIKWMEDHQLTPNYV